MIRSFIEPGIVILQESNPEIWTGIDMMVKMFLTDHAGVICKDLQILCHYGGRWDWHQLTDLLHRNDSPRRFSVDPRREMAVVRRMKSKNSMPQKPQTVNSCKSSAYLPNIGLCCVCFLPYHSLPVSAFVFTLISILKLPNRTVNPENSIQTRPWWNMI